MTDHLLDTILVGFIDESLDELLPLDRRPFEPGAGEPRRKMPHCASSQESESATPSFPEKVDAQNGKISTAQTPPPVTNLFDKTSVDSAASFMNRSSAEVTL